MFSAAKWDILWVFLEENATSFEKYSALFAQYSASITQKSARIPDRAATANGSKFVSDRTLQSPFILSDMR